MDSWREKWEYAKARCWLWLSSESDTADYEVCVHCHGSGWIPVDEATGLIAVAASDARLRPRRTKLFIAGTVAVTALLGGLFVYFLFPRTVTMDWQGRIRTVHSYIPPKECPLKDRHINITFTQTVRLKNENYVPAYIQSLECSVWYHRMFSGSVSYRDLYIPKRSSLELNVVVSADDVAPTFLNMLIRNCMFFPQEDKFELKFNGSIGVLNQVQSLYQELSEFVNCRNSTDNHSPYAIQGPSPCFPQISQISEHQSLQEDL